MYEPLKSLSDFCQNILGVVDRFSVVDYELCRSMKKTKYKVCLRMNHRDTYMDEIVNLMELNM